MKLHIFIQDIYGKKFNIQLLLLFFLAFLSASAQVLLTYHLGLIIDAASKGYSETLYHFSIILISFFFFIGSSTLFILYSGQITTLFSYRLRRKIGEKLCMAQYQAIESKKDGELLTMVTKDIDGIKEWIISLAKIGSLPAQLGFIPFFIIWYNQKFALFTILLIPLTAIPELLISKKLHLYHKAEKAAHANVLSFFTMSIEMIIVIKSFYLEKQLQKKNQQLLSDYKKAQMKRVLKEQLLQVYGHYSGHISNILILLLGAYFILSGEMSFGILTSITLLANLVGEGLTILNEIPICLQNAKGSLLHIQTLLQLPDEPTSHLLSVPFPSPVEDNSKTPIYHIESLSFQYYDKPILQDITFSIYPGEKIAVVGSSGCGKTTLFKLLSGLYIPQKNQIYFQGRDISTIPPASLRTNITITTQETFLFYASFQDNIRIAEPEQPLNTVIAAAKHAQIDSFIQSFTQGYHTIINPIISPISNGQMQRINLARAFIKNTEIYLLDEPTSALDPDTTKQIFDYLFTAYADKALFIILHDKKELHRFDKILILEDGKLAGFDTHSRLLSNCTAYQRLYNKDILTI